MKEKNKKNIYFFDSENKNNLPNKKSVKSRRIGHFFFSLLIIVSIPYFLVDVFKRAYLFFVPDSGPIVSVNDEKNAPLQGSNDDDTDSVKGNEVPVNPHTSGQYYFLGPQYKIPSTSGLAYTVADIETGEVIIEKNPDIAMPIASVSKLITAIVAKENMEQHKTITVTKSSIETYGTSGGLSVGEKILVSDLFYPLLMESSNDAAEVFAEGYGREEFIKKMNEKAKEIGMNNTFFFEPSGLSEKNVSTTADLQKLAAYISHNYPDLWDITRVRQYSILKHSWGNGNRLSRRANFVGGKNGFTYEAHNTTVSVFDVDVEGGKKRFAITLLKSNDREGDVDALLRFLSKWVGYLAPGQEL